MNNSLEILADFGNGFIRTKSPFEGLDFTMSQDSKFKSLKRKLFKNRLEFCKEEGRELVALLNSCNRCDPVRVKMKCGGTLIDGRMNLLKGRYDEDNCLAELGVETVDEYTCLLDEWETERNLCDIENKVEVSTYLGEIVTAGTRIDPYTGSDMVNDALPPDNSGTWTLAQVCVEEIDSECTGQSEDLSALWIREEVTSIGSPGAGWINISGNLWARPIVTGSSKTTNNFIVGDCDLNNNGGSDGIEVVTTKCTEFTYLPDLKFNNGYTLADTLIFLASFCELEVCSDFYGINPIGDAPDNEAYQCALNDKQNIVLFQKTAVKFPDAEGIEINCPKDLKTLMCDLHEMDNVSFTIENGKMRIEHASYYESNKKRGLDLTVLHPEALKGKGKYTLEQSQRPEYEVWSWMDDTTGVFANMQLKYCDCYEINKRNERKIECFNPDILGILRNPDNADDFGFVPMATVEFNGEFVLLDNNNAFSSERLLGCYWKDCMFAACMIINGEQVCANTIRRDKIQDPISIPMCCKDSAQFDPNDLVKTQLGWGEVVSYEYSVKEECLELTLAHDQFYCCDVEEDCCQLIDSGSITEGFAVNTLADGFLIFHPANFIAADFVRLKYEECKAQGATLVLEIEGIGNIVVEGGDEIVGGAGIAITEANTDPECDGGFEHQIFSDLTFDDKTLNYYCYKCIG